MNGNRMQRDFEGQMASVTAIGSEVFVSCVEEIDVSVEVEYGGVWLCCGRNI